MGLAILPVVVFLALLVGPKGNLDSPRDFVPSSDALAVYSNVAVENYGLSTDSDYDVILRFISTRYKKTSAEDAQLISRALVDSAKRYDVDPKFVAALIARESGFNKTAVSATGARGLGQIQTFNFKSLKIEDPEDISQNVSGTVQYVKSMLKRWRGHSQQAVMALASYFKGYTAIKTSETLDEQTARYVSDILKTYEKIK